MKRFALLSVALLAGCNYKSEPVADLQLQPTTIPASITLAARIVDDTDGTPVAWLDFTNTSSQDVQIGHGACAFAIQLSNARGVTAWRNVPDTPYVCAMIETLLTVPANATSTVQVGRIAATGMVAAPPVGQFAVAVLLNQSGQLRQVPAGSVVLR